MGCKLPYGSLLIPAGLMKVGDFFNTYLNYLTVGGMTEKTVNEHARFMYEVLLQTVAESELDDLRLTDTAKVIDIGRHHGEYGAQRSVVVFRRLLKYIQESGHKVPFDWRDIPIPKVPAKPVEYLTDQEFLIIRNSFDLSSLSGLRCRTLIEVLYDTGMRISEAVSLLRDDIDWENKEVWVVNAKTKEKSKVFFTDRSLTWIKLYLDRRNDNVPYLFVNERRQQLLTQTSRSFIRKHLRTLGINKHICHHIFRRTFVTKLIQQNVDIKSVQTLARHKSERTTLKCYTGVDVERAKKLHQIAMS